MQKCVLAVIATALAWGVCGVAAAQTTHTVCPSGCDFPSPAACAIGDHDGDGLGDGTRIANGDTCLVLGGEYHETVRYQTSPFIGRRDLVFRCAPGETCVIDGDDERDHGFEAYDEWVVEGFEITNTVSHAITAYYEIAGVRDCWIHDLRGRGIENLGVGAVVERNRIENTVDAAVVCKVANNGQTIRNNLVLRAGLGGAQAILCTGNATDISHNTVDQRDRTAPFGNPSAYGIDGGNVSYNLVVGSNVSIRATTSASDNLVWGWATDPYSGVAAEGVNGNATGDPMFHDVADHHLLTGSPAIDAAIGSTATDDLEQSVRSGVPDLGALEYDPAHATDPGPWPVREIAAELVDPSSQASVLLPGEVPAFGYYDKSVLGVRYAVFLDDGSWYAETVDASEITSWSTPNDPMWRFVDMAVDPTDGTPVLAWVQSDTGRRTIRVARREGDECGTDCTSAAWSGCGDTPPIDVTTSDQLSIRLQMTADGRPAIVALHQVSGGCGSLQDRFDLKYFERDSGGTWSVTPIAGDCTYHQGRGFDFVLSPTTGAAEVVVVRSTDFDTFNSLGELVHWTNASGSFVSTVVPLGVDTIRGERTVAALAAQADGDLGAAVQVTFGDGREGLAFAERTGGTWGGGAWVQRTSLGSTTPGACKGASVAWNAAGDPLLAVADNGILSLARRSGGDWDWSTLDARVYTGAWPRLHVLTSGGTAVGSSRMEPDTDLELLSTEALSGVAVSTLDPPACDDGNACTVEMCGVGGCTSVALACDDGNACTTNGCNPSTGCVYTPRTGESCDDGDACTSGDACTAGGACAGSGTVACDDGSACTTDSCDSSTGCIHTPRTGESCDDGDVCTTGDACTAGGTCAGGGTLACDDGSACTTDSCDSSTGCIHTPRTGESCDDGDACTTGDACTAGGACAGSGTPSCDDGSACTTDSCDSSTGCIHTPRTGESCDDGSVCTTGDTCTAGGVCAGSAVSCDDSEGCTTDSCDPSTGCIHTPRTGESCDDGDACTTGDACSSAGICVGGGVAPSCVDAGPPDAGPPDAGPPDAGPLDAGPPDAGPPDAGPMDAGPPDAGSIDAGPMDAGPPDAGDAGEDAGDADASAVADGSGISADDAGPSGGEPVDEGGCGCRVPVGSRRPVPIALGIGVLALAVLRRRRRGGGPRA